MDTIDNLMNIFPNENEINPLIEMIEQVMEIPEENLTDDNIDIISGMISGAFTSNIKEQSIKEEPVVIEEMPPNTGVYKIAKKFIVKIINGVKKFVECAIFLSSVCKKMLF